MKNRAEAVVKPIKEAPKRTSITEHIVEIVSDSGEGAQKVGQSFGAISAKMGNGVWTVEIIPADIQPPARTRESASGVSIRIGSEKITNAGDEADVLVAFNEIVPYTRIDLNAYKKGTIVLIENMWANHESEEIRESYARAMEDFLRRGYVIHEIPMEEQCLKITANPKKGKNMWVLGLLCFMYDRNMAIAQEQVKTTFRKKSEAVIETNLKLLDAGYEWAEAHLQLRYNIPTIPSDKELLVMNGNEALGLGIAAAGIEVCSIYPITPATSTSHSLAEYFHNVGGVMHQAEDELAAIGFAIGASYAGKTAVTVTSGPGIALKTEFIGLGVMAEVPLVIIAVQRGGPSTGLPTKVEQGDLLSVMYGQPGDAPKIVLAPSTIEECFQFVILARQIAEAFRMPVFILSDANLATGVTTLPRPSIRAEWFSPPVDQSAWKEGVNPYQWNEESGLSKRPIPGQKGGEYTLTGLAHSDSGKVTYQPDLNQKSAAYRSRKLAAFGQTLKPPKVYGDHDGDLLLIGWGSTRGAIEEAVDILRAKGLKISSLNLHFLSPLEPGLREIFQRFKKVMTVEINYSDDPSDPLITSENRRYSQLAWILRAHTLLDVDCFSNVHGLPLNPGKIVAKVNQELNR
ncbi:MAG: 2-oxoacid:acceptor oxidoreductase subunit alpha [Saprospiraceae bacterium]|nr:2-oxoacid:acceptor oxidoreductase subunit alpha [Saprospiraceae bacterium]